MMAVWEGSPDGCVVSREYDFNQVIAKRFCETSDTQKSIK